MNYAAITAIGSYVPDNIMTNADLERIVDTTDEWIARRTGIRERRIVSDDEYTSDLCERAVRDLLTRYQQSAEDIDLIIVCTHTPDFPFPSVSCLLQDRIGADRAGAVDLNATCAGTPYGLQMAHGLVAAGLHRKVLVVGADTMSRITDYTDRTSCILFGDGAGAFMVEASKKNGFLSHHVDADGSGGIHSYRTGMANKWNGSPLKDSGCFVQNGREVYKWAVGTVPDAMRKLADAAGFEDVSAVDWFVPHNANLRMIESICEKSGFPFKRTLHTVEKHGNTSGASIPLALDDGVKQGRVKSGDTALLYGFGAGLVQAGLIVRLQLDQYPDA